VKYSIYFTAPEGELAATKAFSDLADVGVAERNDFDTAFWKEVGSLKSVHPKVSLDDCCAIALTQRVG